MSEKTKPVIEDPTPLYEAARALLGYFLNTWYRHFLIVMLQNLQNWWIAGLLDKDRRPNAVFQEVLFDFNALNLEKLAYVCGIYFCVQSSHKNANYSLLQKEPKKRVLYLRGFDYEAAVSPAKGLAMGISTTETFVFNDTIGQHLGPDFEVFKVLSPKDLHWETTGPQRYFYDDYEKIIQACSSRPIRSVYLNAQHWKDDVAHLAERMDYFVVYVSSITESVLWELNHLKESGCADRTTVVFDRPAILKKIFHYELHERLPKLNIGKVVWAPSKKRSTEEDVDALRAELDKIFIVVSADAFKESVPVLKARIAAANGPLPPGARETYLDFRFYPALDDAALDYLHRLDAALWQEIDPEGTREIDCLPFHINQVQLRIFMSLLFGAHHEAGRALAVYAGIMDAALDFYTAAGQSNDGVSQEYPSSLTFLQNHRDTAAHIAWSFLCSGQSHEFGDYTEAARSTYDRIFAAARQRAARFMHTKSRVGGQP